MSRTGPGAGAWHAGTLVGFDLETTGVDPTIDRVVSAAVVRVDPAGRILRARSWLVDPGRSIPEAATDIHGISTQRARAAGTPSAAAIPEIIAELESAWRAGLPVVIFNAPYDLTLLDAEAVRAGLPRLGARDWWRAAWVVDPLVVDRGVDPYRRGKRTLAAAAEHYGVVAENAHSAIGDAVAATAVARAIARQYQSNLDIRAKALHRSQIRWHRLWATSFQTYLRSRGDETVFVDRTWPLRPPVLGRHRNVQRARPAGRSRLLDRLAGRWSGTALILAGQRPGGSRMSGRREKICP